jgi:hypothetical protein
MDNKSVIRKGLFVWKSHHHGVGNLSIHRVIKPRIPEPSHIAAFNRIHYIDIQQNSTDPGLNKLITATMGFSPYLNKSMIANHWKLVAFLLLLPLLGLDTNVPSIFLLVSLLALPLQLAIQIIKRDLAKGGCKIFDNIILCNWRNSQA